MFVGPRPGRRTGENIGIPAPVNQYRQRVLSASLRFPRGCRLILTWREVVGCQHDQRIKVGELASRTGVSVRTLHYYDEILAALAVRTHAVEASPLHHVAPGVWDYMAKAVSALKST